MPTRSAEKLLSSRNAEAQGLRGPQRARCRRRACRTLASARHHGVRASTAVIRRLTAGAVRPLCARSGLCANLPAWALEARWTSGVAALFGSRRERRERREFVGRRRVGAVAVQVGAVSIPILVPRRGRPTWSGQLTSWRASSLRWSRSRPKVAARAEGNERSSGWSRSQARRPASSRPPSSNVSFRPRRCVRRTSQTS
jgi:hypothetical protein